MTISHAGGEWNDGERGSEMKCPQCSFVLNPGDLKCMDCGYKITDFLIQMKQSILLNDAIFLKDATVEQLKEELHKRQEIRVREEITAILTRALAAIQNGEEIGLAMGNMHNDLHRATVNLY